MKRKRIYYFAYGSNMSRKQMNYRMHDFVPVVGTYKMKGWKLYLDTGRGWCTFADIEEGDKDDYVEGVLYELSHSQMYDLDGREGLYERVFFDFPEYGEDALLCVYIGLPQFKHMPKGYPLEAYIQTCMDGASENGLLDTYRFLKDYKNKNYKKTTTYEDNWNSRLPHRR